MSKNPLSVLVAKLRTRSPLDDKAEVAILGLPYTHKTYEAPAYIVREGATDIGYCSLIVAGYAFRQKLTAEGARQIVAVHMRGDLLDLQHIFLNRADHNVQALTQLETLNIDRVALQQLILDEPTVARAIWTDALIDASVFREWIVNIGHRNARSRVAHLLCELAARMKAAGLSDGPAWPLPMTQEQLGDAVGLTAVHVNRTLKALEKDGIIKRNRREVSFSDWDALRRIGEFSALYLHLDQVDPDKKSFELN